MPGAHLPPGAGHEQKAHAEHQVNDDEQHQRRGVGDLGRAGDAHAHGLDDVEDRIGDEAESFDRRDGSDYGEGESRAGHATSLNG